jgi:hypothetical protein
MVGSVPTATLASVIVGAAGVGGLVTIGVGLTTVGSLLGRTMVAPGVAVAEGRAVGANEARLAASGVAAAVVGAAVAPVQPAKSTSRKPILTSVKLLVIFLPCFMV